jgi:membrane protein insertase Oxa1/YidC/SpoIIIJ
MVFKGLQHIDTSLLYSFIDHPGTYNMQFFFFDLMAKSSILAACAGLTQYVQTDLSLGRQKIQESAHKNNEKGASFQEDLAKSMQVQMRYVLPVMISFIAYSAPAAVALYWTTSNILSITQELLMRRKPKVTQ